MQVYKWTLLVMHPHLIGYKTIDQGKWALNDTFTLAHASRRI